MTRRFRRRPPGWLWLVVCLAVALTMRWRLGPRVTTPTLPSGPAQVVAAIDGRTLTVTTDGENGATTTLRLLGLKTIDDAAAQTWLNDNVVGQSVRIDLDKRRRAADGAQLAYVYLGRTFVNAELIRRGWAEHEAYPGDSASHAKLMREAK